MPGPVLLPLWPRPGLSETLEWLTDLIEFEDGGEEASEMRDGPRQTIDMEFYVAPAIQPTVANLLYGARTYTWQVPLWQQVQNVGVVAPGATTLAAETRYSEFEAGGQALLFTSPTEYEIVEIDAVAGVDTLSLAAPVVAGQANAWLAPIRIGRLTSNPDRSFNGRNSTLRCSFLIDDTPNLTVAAPTQYLGADAYFDPGLLDGGSVPERLDARVDVFDPRVGLTSYIAPWLYNRPERTHRMMGENPAENWAIREFLHRRRGRAVRFWQPSFEADFRVNDSGPVTTALSVWPDGFNTYASARNHAAIELADGTWLARRISSMNYLGADELQLIFDTTLGGIDAATISRISLMGLKRLSADRAEINWMGGTVAACSVNTTEIEP